MKHIIFSDVDGTIYPFNKKIHPQTLVDIANAQSKGVEFVICTGNGYFDNMNRLSDLLKARFVITSNGASIFDKEKNDFIFKSVIPWQKADTLLQKALQLQLCANWWDEKHIYFNKHSSQYVLDVLSNASSEERNFVKDVSVIKSDIFKIEIYDDKHHYIDQIEKLCDELGLHYSRMRNEHIEITHEGVSKGEGIKWLANYLNLDLENTAGVGDSPNDISMFQTVAHSYVMDNATAKVKEEAKHFTSAVEQNGLGEAIVDYLYRSKID